MTSHTSGFLDSADSGTHGAILYMNCCYHVVFCACDIYCSSVRPKKDSSSVVVPEVGYFPCLGEFFLNRFEGLRI